MNNWTVKIRLNKAVSIQGSYSVSFNVEVDVTGMKEMEQIRSVAIRLALREFVNVHSIDLQDTLEVIQADLLTKLEELDEVATEQIGSIHQGKGSYGRGLPNQE